MEYVALVVLLAVMEYLFFVAMVGKARGMYSVRAPATSGHDIFERYYRVQQNTLEQLAIFIPSIYLFAMYVNATAAAGIGVLFLVGRVLYYKAYIADPASRGPGMIIGFAGTAILLLGALVGVIIELL